MTDPIRTPAEALEAAAKRIASEGHPALAEEIRALAPRIAEPDAEALVEMMCNNDRVLYAWLLPKGSLDNMARAVLAALREAGALR